MKMHRINISYSDFTVKKPIISSIIMKCIDATLKAEGVRVPCEINVLVTNNSGIQAINAASRNLDQPTDVLSFPMFKFQAGILPKCWKKYIDPESGLCPLGDMAISLERAAEQAKSFGHSLRREIGYLTIHSVLHLLGYDHLDEGEQKKQMRIREELIAATVSGVQR